MRKWNGLYHITKATYVFRAEAESDEGEKLHVLVTYDESNFLAYDAARYVWALKGERPLRKKSQRRLIHVTDFLCNTIGRLAKAERQQVSKRAEGDLRDYSARKSNDGWSARDVLLAQVANYSQV
ncbi:uncharacterized protein CCR75_001513 [Bremia lactucae]|uniref:Uncharacterized protein n=1 Tax=Bremia lactucae TaxID=4779 RepID=A0A976FG14_BRELC|nr:hypothetical protein CCR75_001513 [Bremia lactucae]